ncbi:uncharacterized protein K452DRAFT_351730 [Aplosporella prunicola CBS 121167]|uniref:Major facilitator superfamily (MFS) profile domain-containing protein n=1 Tax=Aplosporella prunicola CBS 121167 TaxID=1176127 RepID=A0A6A6BDT8_9PEZI|nr:uncharacterized protein K452DRAFT_351730 [Aplosporella prunicola CBS 121167]KAF2141087.1 hypothetical protein K452DRAFT_351730 [Aplosporella prunicola CBS 121167]
MTHDTTTTDSHPPASASWDTPTPRNDSPDPEKGGPLPTSSDDENNFSKIDWADDPENPHNWPMGKRILHTVVPSAIAFVTTFGSSVYTPGRAEIMTQFGVGSVVAILPFALYTLGLALGPLIASPCSENFGRRAVYFVCTPIFGLFILGAGFSNNIAALTICRFFAGAFGSPALSVGNATLSDVWRPHERAVPMALIVCCPFLGPTLGPLIGGFVVEGESWRWTEWVILFFMVAFLCPAFLMSETYKKQILLTRAKKAGLDLTRTQTNASRSSRAASGARALLMNTVGRPVHMLFTEPIIGLFSLYVAFVFAMQYAFFAAFPWVFRTQYGFNLGSQGLTFLGLGVGCFVGFSTIVGNFYLFERPRAQRWRAQQAQLAQQQEEEQAKAEPGADAAPPVPALPRNPPPEFTLFIAYPGSFLLPSSLFLFAWTAAYKVHWIVPVIAETLFGVSMLLIFMACTLYLMNTYGPLYGASAMAACSLLRYVLGCAFPLFILQMYEKLGVGWATSLLGFVSVAMAVIPWCFVRWGETLRRKSRYPCEA